MLCQLCKFILNFWFNFNVYSGRNTVLHLCIKRKNDGLYYLWDTGYSSVNTLVSAYIGKELYPNCGFVLTEF